MMRHCGSGRLTWQSITSAATAQGQTDNIMTFFIAQEAIFSFLLSKR
jgi:hypothetical protein